MDTRSLLSSEHIVIKAVAGRTEAFIAAVQAYLTTLFGLSDEFGSAEIVIRLDDEEHRFRWLDDERCWAGRRRLVHNDLSPNHTLVDETGALRGILDWADAAVDDPAQDFAAPYVAFGADGLDRLLAAYDRAGGAPHERFREHVVLLAEFRYRVSLGLHGLRTGNDDYVALARARLADPVLPE